MSDRADRMGLGLSRMIFLVRHGETDWSAEGKHTGRTDLPLNEDGRARAKELADQLRGHDFSLVLCSPLRRAQETCELAGFGAQASTCDELHEWDYGEYEGLTTAEIHAERPDWNLWRDGCPEGESPAEVAARADRVIDRVGERGTGNVLVFAHGHILRVLAARWIGSDPPMGAHLLLGAAGLCILTDDRGTPAIDLWNAARIG